MYEMIWKWKYFILQLLILSYFTNLEIKNLIL